MKKKVLALTMCAAMAASVLAGCGDKPASDTDGTTGTSSESAASSEPVTESPAKETASSVSESGDKPKVVFQALGSVAPYVAGQIRAYESIAEEYGWDFVVLDGQGDSVQNAKDMETAISMNPDVIISMSVDVAATSAAYKKAAEKGIPVLIETIAVLPEDEQYTVGYTGPNDYDHGVAVAEMMNEKLGGKGNVVVLTTPPGQSTTDLRMTGFTETLDKLGSDIKVLGVNNNDNMKDLAIEVMQDFITQFGDDIDGVYAMEDYGALGAQIALKEAGYTPEDVVVIGVGGSAEGLQAVKDGLIYGTTLQAPSIDCAQTAELVQKIIDGEIKPPVQLDPYFNYMELPKITAENVEQYLPGEW